MNSNENEEIMATDLLSKYDLLKAVSEKSVLGVK